ncbi:MAG: M24 family metallopeptidase [Euryarchaeota archaeon]|jgi:Xaa-Pro aminopeptidase|nr:M24 family metallopeptidase [Euryarchaeota archaeon]MBT3757473.1 M24 family metallopeptidase [Euryarchaeota archaeon]MBT4050565.1 M24 family metallopeptidase [Euryarchaeota archaeon]MBT4650698.1 M24 family metallopeptidase [Euryarchaeota archaeon]MBT4961659.1 M24 family metallopeptidase [Euryarchaeota archaeon]|tara:strand:+ start:13611 stop:14951 length:1341 start_codon:yes stop_codon:yes gene_type:complete
MAKLAFPILEYIERQRNFYSKLPKDTLLIIPANPSAVRSNDVHYPYRANSYQMYLSGWNSQGAVLTAQYIDEKWITSLFVQSRDVTMEIWEGRRIGTERAKSEWPIDESYSLNDLIPKLEEFLKDCKQVHIIQNLSIEVDTLIHRVLTTKSRARNVSGTGPISITDPSSILDEMRVIKSDLEIDLMKQSAELASDAHILAMQASYSGINEFELQAVIEGYFVSNGSQWSYPSIVGGGDNGTILHYSKNNCPIEDGELVLVDAGCEIEGYASDITRTWPVNGKFSEAQKEIYQLVLRAELAAIDACVIGAAWNSSHVVASKIIAQGLIDLGILECDLQEALGDNLDGEYRKFFMHGTSHFLGLDVHDVGITKPDPESAGRSLEAGMVLTIEPGLYFGSWRSDVKFPQKYSKIAVRIEDDILITKKGPVVLTKNCPKTLKEIEKLVGN